MENIQNVFMRLFQCKSAEFASLIHGDELHRRLFFFDEFADSTSKVLVSVRRMASLSFEVKDYDTTEHTSWEQ